MERGTECATLHSLAGWLACPPPHRWPLVALVLLGSPPAVGGKSFLWFVRSIIQISGITFTASHRHGHPSTHTHSHGGRTLHVGGTFFLLVSAHFPPLGFFLLLFLLTLLVQFRRHVVAYFFQYEINCKIGYKDHGETININRLVAHEAATAKEPYFLAVDYRFMPRSIPRRRQPREENSSHLPISPTLAGCRCFNFIPSPLGALFTHHSADLCTHNSREYADVKMSTAKITATPRLAHAQKSAPPKTLKSTRR